MLQTEFRREMGCSGSFASVRGRPQSCGGVCGGVFLDDFGKIVRSCSLKCVRVWSRQTPSPYFRELFSAALSPEIDCAAVGFGGLAFWDVCQSSQCASMLLWSAQEPSRSWLFLLKRTRCSVQEGAVEPPAPLAPNTEAVASAEPQSRTTSSSALEAAAGRLAPVDRNTGAMASA